MNVVVDSLRSAHNVGSILRTADALGIKKVYLCGTTPAPVDRFGRENQRVTKVSLGAEKSVAWEVHPDTATLLATLKKDGMRVVALEQDESAVEISGVTLSEADSTRTTLVIGPEVTGLSPVVLALADQIVEIPMHGAKESLNVAVAFGIAAYTLLNQSKTSQK